MHAHLAGVDRCLSSHTLRPLPVRLEPLEPRQLLAADVVIEWDNIAINAIRADRHDPGPGWSSRNLAMVHGAIYDAVNSIDHGYKPYLLRTQAPTWADIDAAAATAAERVLCNLFPDQKSTFVSALNADLAQIPNGAAKLIGIAFGRRAADAMLKARARDGSAINVTYEPGTQPGQWQPTWPNYAPAWGPNWGKVKPFVIKNPNQFLPPPFPALTSDAYTQSYNEVKSLGAADSTTRTPDQTQISDFWAYDTADMGTPMVLYNQITQTIAEQQGNSTVQNARLFALTNFAMADAGIICWNAKFKYDIWRPITAIQSGDSDGNPNTIGDPNWIPLGAPTTSGERFTPPFPAYTSGHATFASAMFNVLSQFYGTDNISYTLTSDELPGVTRSYTTFSQANDENAWSRIYMGVHWSFDRIYGQSEGAALANYVSTRMLQPATPFRDRHTPINNVTDAPVSLSQASSLRLQPFSTTPISSTNSFLTSSHDPLASLSPVL